MTPNNQGHFFAAAAEAMRRNLVNHARNRNRLKRGGERVRLELLDQVGDPDFVLSLDELLSRLGEEDAAAARVAQIHLFGGLSVRQAPALMDHPNIAKVLNAGLTPGSQPFFVMDGKRGR